MDILSWFVIGFFGTFIITSCIAIDNEIEGPFYIYTAIRKFVRLRFMPKLIRENAGCYICTSFYAGLLISIFLPIYDGRTITQSAGILFVFTYGLHGSVVFLFRYLRTIYAISPSDF